MKPIRKTYFSFLVAATLVFVACDNANEDANPTAPQLPPAESMSAEMGAFPSNGENSSKNDNQDREHFTYAAANVVFWQSILKLQLAVPVAAFKESFNHPFIYLQDEQRWKSSYSVTVGDKTYEATLYGEREEDEIEWQMYLSAEGQFENFLWFTGESELDNTGGSWILYKSPSEPRAVLTIEWEKEGNEVEAAYTLVDEQADKVDSYIEYGTTTENGFTHFYEVSIESKTEEDYEVFILYNANTRAGKVKSESRFGDDAFRCWDSNFIDTTCSN